MKVSSFADSAMKISDSVKIVEKKHIDRLNPFAGGIYQNILKVTLQPQRKFSYLNKF